jgi:hypothetical protein
MRGEKVEVGSMEKNKSRRKEGGSKVGTKSRRHKRNRLNSRIEIGKLEEE